MSFDYAIKINAIQLQKLLMLADWQLAENGIDPESVAAAYQIHENNSALALAGNVLPGHRAFIRPLLVKAAQSNLAPPFTYSARNLGVLGCARWAVVGDGFENGHQIFGECESKKRADAYAIVLTAWQDKAWSTLQDSRVRSIILDAQR